MMTRDRPILMGGFAVGDLVRVIDGTHDPSLPSHRVGLVVGVMEASNTAPHTYIYEVQFGASILRFHEMWLDNVES